MGHWSQATGIDIPMLDNVINYHFLSQPKLFVHRVGKSPLHASSHNYCTCHNYAWPPLPHHMTIILVTWPISPIGRVARAGRSERAYSLVSHDEVAYMIDLHLFLGRPITYKGSDGEKLTYRIIDHKHVTVHYKVIVKQIHCLLLLLYYSPVVCRSVWECPSISGWWWGGFPETRPLSQLRPGTVLSYTTCISPLVARLAFSAYYMCREVCHCIPDHTHR